MSTLLNVYSTTIECLGRASSLHLWALHAPQPRISSHPVPLFDQEALYYMPHDVLDLPNRSHSFKQLYPLLLHTSTICKLKWHCTHSHICHRVPQGCVPRNLYSIAQAGFWRALLLRILMTIRQSLITKLLHLWSYQSSSSSSSSSTASTSHYTRSVLSWGRLLIATM